MDPITTSIILALSELGKNVIDDAYQALKLALQKKYGLNSDLSKAVNDLEKKPDSAGRQETLKEEVAIVNANQDAEILKLAQDLQSKLDNARDTSKTSKVIQQQAGDNALQIGDVGGDVNIKQ